MRWSCWPRRRLLRFQIATGNVGHTKNTRDNNNNITPLNGLVMASLQRVRCCTCCKKHDDTALLSLSLSFFLSFSLSLLLLPYCTVLYCTAVVIVIQRVGSYLLESYGTYSRWQERKGKERKPRRKAMERNGITWSAARSERSMEYIC